MYGHFTVDMYVGLLPVLYPLLTDRFALDLKTVGLLSLAYSGTASISQPFFGWIADRYGTRFAGLALIWTATMFATIGFAPTFPILLLLPGRRGSAPVAITRSAHSMRTPSSRRGSATRRCPSM